MAQVSQFGPKVFDSHIHPGFEKKGIEKRPGCMRLWLAKEGVTSATQIAMRIALGDPNPTKPITCADDIPEFSVETWIKLMNDNGVEKALLMGMDTISDPPYNEPWHVPMEYIKEEFLDKYPDRFVAVAGINVKASKEARMETLYKAKELGFKGVKIHTPTAGYPNDVERCYPVYEKCVELGLHVEIHKGQEEIPGTRFLEQFAPHKVFFGTDAPLILSIYSTVLGYIKLLPLSPQFKKMLLYDNAYNFYCGDWREKQAAKAKGKR